MKVPYCCPVCNGNGLVDCGFYSRPVGMPFSSTSISYESCRSCNGTGIIWSREDEKNQIGEHDASEFYKEE